jgi:hypothetical protein
VRDFPGQTADVRVEIPVGPTAQALSSGRLGAVMNEPMNLAAHLLKQVVEFLTALFPTNDGAHIDSLAAGMIMDLPK